MFGAFSVIKMEPLIAHRGASAYAPENTFAAFNQAVALGARAIEFDVMLSAEGELVVFHDETLNRTSNGQGAVIDASTSYITSLDAGTWFAAQFQGETIPTLSDVLQWLLVHQIQANVELKPLPGMAEQLVEAFLKCLRQYWPVKAPLLWVSSFDVAVLRTCAKLSPELPLAVLFKQWDKNWIKLAEEVQAVAVHLSQYIVRPRRVAAIKKAGYGVCIYTVNTKKLAAFYFGLGADSVISDYPNLIDRKTDKKTD
jgi:glycerophosphoryl diester phosphodiesterase